MTVKQIVDSKRFESTVCVLIVGNAALLGAQTYLGGSWAAPLNSLFVALFIVEITARWIAGGRQFLSSRWNLFDLAVVTLSVMPGVGPLAQVARLARVARLIRFMPAAQTLLKGAGKAIPALGSLLALTSLMIFLYGMAGVALLGEEMPERFGDIGAASLTLFVMLSLENFPDVLYAGTEVTPWALPFFLSYAVVAAFIVFNLLIGVVIASLEEAREEDAEPGVELADLQNQLNQMQTSIDSVLYNKRYGFRHQAKTPHRKEVKL